MLQEDVHLERTEGSWAGATVFFYPVILGLFDPDFSEHFVHDSWISPEWPRAAKPRGAKSSPDQRAKRSPKASKRASKLLGA